MGKLMKKYLLAFLLALAAVELVYAAATKLTDLTVTGNLIVTGTTTHTGATTQTGVLNLSASTPYAIKVSSKTAAIPAGTPTAAGLIAFDSNYVMYVSTGTGPAAWVKIGGQ